MFGITFRIDIPALDRIAVSLERLGKIERILEGMATQQREGMSPLEVADQTRRLQTIVRKLQEIRKTNT